MSNKVTKNGPGGGGTGGGVNVATDKLSGTQSGNNTTLDLTQLSHTFKTILLVTKDGQTVTPTTGWTISTNTITVINALSTQDYLVQYTY